MAQVRLFYSVKTMFVKCSTVFSCRFVRVWCSTRKNLTNGSVRLELSLVQVRFVIGYLEPASLVREPDPVHYRVR